jgi:uncharacterized protein (DUF58 family)
MAKLAQSKYFDPALFNKIGNLQLLARTLVEGTITGKHQSPYRGFSAEFSEYRKYTPGDEIKHIDWKALGRTDKVYIKEFQAETNMKAYLLLDVSASMGYTSGPLSKLQYACTCAAALAYLMIRQQDAVGLFAFDEDLRHALMPKSGPRQLQDILTVLDGLAPGGKTSLSHTFHQLAERIRRRGLIAVFSDFLDEPELLMRGLAHFRQKKHEVILFHLIDAHEEDFPFEDFVEFQDLETGARLPVHARMIAPEVRRRYQAFVQDLKRRCAEHAIEHVPLRTDRPVELALLQYLAKRQRLG